MHKCLLHQLIVDFGFLVSVVVDAKQIIFLGLLTDHQLNVRNLFTEKFNGEKLFAYFVLKFLVASSDRLYIMVEFFELGFFLKSALFG